MSNEDDGSGKLTASDWSRRKALKALGAAGVPAAMAGCGGDGGDGGTGTPTQTGTQTGTGDGGTQTETATPTATTLEDVDQDWVGMTQSTPTTTLFEDRDLKMWIVDHWAMRPPLMSTIFQKYWYNFAEQPGIMESVDYVDANEIQINLNPGHNWSNGEPVTGEDLYTYFKTHQLMFGPGRSNLTPEDAGWLYGFTDATWDTNRLTLLNDEGYFAGTPPYAIEESFKGYMQQHNRFQHGSHLEDLISKAEDAAPNGDPRHEDAKQRITDWWWNYHLAAENGVEWPNAHTNGPFQVAELTNNEWRYEPNPHFKFADKINWDQLRLQYRENNNALWAAMQSGNIDGAAVTTPAHVVEQFADSYRQALKPFPDGAAFTMNHRAEFSDGEMYFNDHRVRQALAHVLDREQLANTHHSYAAEALDVPIDIGTLQQEDLSDVDLDTTLEDFNHYPHTDEGLSTAEDLLSAAGLSYQNGQWVQSNGDPFSIELITTAQPPDVELGVVTQLEQFGITAELNTVEDAVMTERASNYPLDYKATVGSWSQVGNQIQDPVGTYHNALRWRGYYANQINMWDPALIEQEVNEGPLQWVQPSEEGAEPVRVQSYQSDEVDAFTIEAPPVGDWDGALEEIPILTDLTPDAENESDVLANQIQLAWYRHFDLPDIPLYETKAQGFQKRDGWILTEDEQWWTQMPGEQIAAGQISADPDA